jgi:transcriptional regulator with XRE-family HTH domain
MNADSALHAEARLVADKVRQLGLSQEHIAQAIGASQSQVSRLLSGTGRRRSRLFQQVCKYVHSQVKPGGMVPAARNPALSAALDEVWDGTEDHAEALALVIRSLGALQRPANSVRPAKPVRKSLAR